MGAISGDVNTQSTYCTDAADLESRPVTSMESGDRAWVEAKVGSPEGPLFFLDKSSTLPIDGVGVLSALGGVGRWLSEVVFIGSGGALVPPPVFVEVTPGTGAISTPLALIAPLSASINLLAGKKLRIDFDASAIIPIFGPAGPVQIQIRVDGNSVGETGMYLSALFAPSCAVFSKVLSLPPGPHTVEIWGNAPTPGGATMDPANPTCHGSLTLSLVD